MEVEGNIAEDSQIIWQTEEGGEAGRQRASSDRERKNGRP